MIRAVLVALLAIASVGCAQQRDRRRARARANQVAPAQRAPAQPVPAQPVLAAAPAQATPADLVIAPAGPSVDAVVRAEQARAAPSGRRIVVYVSASWCEPCQRFQRSLAAGELDSQLQGVRFLKFDADTMRDELRAAGYWYQMIPFFAWPDSTGRASGSSIEGSIHGEQAVQGNLVPRLTAFLSERPG